MSGESYRIGYKCPPKHTQYTKGQSGNPAGRPKKPPISLYGDIGDAFVQGFLQKVTVTNPDGSTKEVGFLEALVLKYLHTALKKGDPRMVSAIFDMMKRASALDTTREPIEIHVTGGLPPRD